MGESRKKLKAVAAWFLGGGDGAAQKSKERTQLALFGFDEAQQKLMMEAIEHTDEEQEVWPDMVQSVEVFSSMLTQWNVGQSGVVGFRYEALPVVFRRHGVTAATRDQVFDDVTMMERAAMEILNNDQ